MTGFPGVGPATAALAAAEKLTPRALSLALRAGIAFGLSGCLWGWAFVSPARAWFEESDVGPRAIGLGRAFTAMADDASALYWNPGGLAGLPGNEAQLSLARPFSVGDLTEAYGVVAHGLAGGRAAVSWQHVGATNVVSENTFTVGYGRTVHEFAPDVRVDAGVAFKMFRVSLATFPDPQTLQTVDYGAASAVAGDLGVLVRLPHGFNVGWTLQNIGSPEFNLIEGTGGGTALPSHQRLGVAYHWNPESTIAVDLQEVPGERARVVMAGEIWFYNSFAVRAGVSGNDAGGGVSIKAHPWLFDFGFLTNQPLGLSYRAGLRVPF